MWMSHPKTRQKCLALLLKITGVTSGVVTVKDKAEAMPSLLTKRFSQVIGVINGNVTPKDKIRISSPLAQNNWSNTSGAVPPKDKTKTMPIPWKKRQ